MKKTIIFGNGVNDLLLEREVKNIHHYIHEKLNEYIKILSVECKGLHCIEAFLDFIKAIDETSFIEKYTFDLLYMLPYEFKYEYEDTFIYRVQDILKSILNSWLIEEFGIHSKNPTSEKILTMIMWFKNKLTINYCVPPPLKTSEMVFLHGSFYKEDKIRRHKIRTLKNMMACDIWIENWDTFFQSLPYVHLSNKYGVGEVKNMDNLIEYIGSKEERENLNMYTLANKISEEQGYKTIKPRSLKEEDYESYELKIPNSDVIVLFGISPSFDEHLIKTASGKSKRLIFVWHTEKDKNSAKRIINRKKDKLVNTKDFLSQYNSMDLLKGKFTHNN